MKENAKPAPNQAAPIRPIIKDLRLIRPEVALSALTATLLVIEWIYAGVSITQLPDRIPVYFDFSKMAVTHGNKGQVLILPAVVTVFTILLHTMAYFPHKYNFTMARITTYNAVQIYTATRLFLRYVNTIIAGVGLFDLIGWIRSVQLYEEFGPWAWIVSIIGILFSISIGVVTLSIYIRAIALEASTPSSPVEL